MTDDKPETPTTTPTTTLSPEQIGHVLFNLRQTVQVTSAQALNMSEYNRKRCLEGLEAAQQTMDALVKLRELGREAYALEPHLGYAGDRVQFTYDTDAVNALREHVLDALLQLGVWR